MSQTRAELIEEMIRDMTMPLNPLKYRRKKYVLNVEVDSAVDGTGSNQLSIDDNPFMWTKITAAAKVSSKEDVTALETSQEFLMRIRDTNRYYDSDFHRPDLAYGNPKQGVVIPFDVPTFLDANATLTGDIINLVARAGDTWNAQIIIHGYERWQR